MDNKRIDPRLVKIIAEGDTDTLISYAMELGQRVAEQDLGRTQIRNIYGMVKAFEAKRPHNYDQLKLLVPKLHYAAARQSKLTPLVTALSDGITFGGGRGVEIHCSSSPALSHAVRERNKKKSQNLAAVPAAGNCPAGQGGCFTDYFTTRRSGKGSSKSKKSAPAG